MSSEQRKAWTRQDAEDAERLCRVLVANSAKRKAAERLEASAQIADQPKADNSARDEIDMGLGTIDRRAPVPLTGEDGSDPVAGGSKAGTGNGWGSGQVEVSRKCWPAEGNAGRSIACPHHDADTVDSLFSVPVLNGNAHRNGEK